jgi:hypothetical protein
MQRLAKTEEFSEQVSKGPLVLHWGIKHLRERKVRDM